ncbi:MAG: rhomboid family intramembrane serine protease [Nanoarchaeota archaeon]
MAEIYGFYPRKKSIFGLLSATTTLIILNVLAFIMFLILLVLFRNNTQSLYDFVALSPLNILHGKYLWTFITSMFMHGNLAHLFFNMFSLAFIGSFVEKIIGRKRFISFYLISGLFAGIVFVALSGLFGNSILGAKIFGDPNISGVGASGAIFGLLGLLAVLVPYSKVYLILGPLLAIVVGSISESALPASSSGVINLLVNFYFVISVFAIFSFNERFRKVALPIGMPLWLLPIVAIIPLVVVGLFVPLPIANTAHFGGLLAGLAYGFYLKSKYRKKTRYISKHFSQ